MIKLKVKTLPSIWFFRFALFLSFTINADVSAKTIEELFTNALLAEAAYVKFDPGESALTFEEKLKDDDKFSDNDKRKILTERFNLLHHLPDQWSGFSATLFKNIGTDEVIFASRGTAGLVDIAYADIGGIVLSGVPQQQVNDLYNYVQRLTSPPGVPYRYAEDSLFENQWVSFGEKTDGAGHADWFASKSVDGVGHSLGGNLTAAFGRLFSDFTKDSYVYNSAGTAGPLATVLAPLNILKMSEASYYRQLGGNASYQGNYEVESNVYASDGINMTTSDIFFNQPGNRVGVNIESSWVPGGNHSSKGLMDSLGVAWSFNKVDASYSLGTHSLLMDAADSDESLHLDKLVEGLNRVATGGATSNMWSGIYNLSNSGLTGQIHPLAGKSASEIISEYNQTDLTKKGVIYAALQGLPFYYVGPSSQYNTISPEDYSPRAISDLAGMLAAQLDANANKRATGSLAELGNVEYSTTFRLIQNLSAGSLTRVRFGRDYGTTFPGSPGEDHSYGLGGDDQLVGLGGNDHLEGGPGSGVETFCVVECIS